MEALFRTVLEMSQKASVVILIILMIRLFLKKAPKKYSYLLWSVTAFRLSIPFSFESFFSIFSVAKPVETLQKTEINRILLNPGIDFYPAITVPEIGTLNPSEGETLVSSSEFTQSMSSMQFFSIIWLMGMAAMILFGIYSYRKIQYEMRTATYLKENVYESDRISSPFLLGFFHPKIYIPYGLDEEVLEIVFLHENVHLKRKDHFIKLFAFILLTIHWLNPLCWIAFKLMSKDMEMSCDEKVLSSDAVSSVDYSRALLGFATNFKLPSPSPLAFGESNVKQRIKNALNFKKPKKVLTIAVGVLCIMVVSVCAADPKTKLEKIPDGTYVPYDVIYLSPLSSYYPQNGDSGLRYIVKGDSFTIVQKESNEIIEKFESVDYEWIELASTSGIINSSSEIETFDSLFYEKLEEYSKKYYVKLSEYYSLMKLDDEIWIVLSDDLIWSAYAIQLQNSPVVEEAGQTTSALDEAIRYAVLPISAPYSTGQTDYFESHVILATESVSATPQIGKNDQKEQLIVYAMVLIQRYDLTDGKIVEIGGSHMPMKITFDVVDESNYQVVDVWWPKDGAYYESSIKENFPEAIWDEALDTQKYILAQIQNCSQQAIVSADLDTEKIIDDLFEVILSSPAESSYSNEYIMEHAIEYRELLYYGDSTFDYIVERFLDGNQTGLKGHIMCQAMQDIYPNEAITIGSYETGQDYFDAWKEHVIGLNSEHGAKYLAENYPAAYRLIQIMIER